MGFLALGLFLWGAYLAFLDKTGASIATYCAAGLCLIFLFLSRFKRFKFGPLEGELWEEKMEEAAKVIDRLQSLAVVVAEPLITLSSRLGRMAMHLTRRESYELMKRIERALDENEVPREKIEQAKREYYRTTMFDLTRPLYGKLKEALDQKVTSLHQQVNSFSGPSGVTDLQGQRAAVENWRAAADWESSFLEVLNAYSVHQHAPAVVRERLANCPFLSDDETGEILEAVDKELSDWQYFLEKQEPPDLEAWLNEPDK